MENVKEKIQNDFKNALLKKKEKELLVLRMIISSLRNKEISIRKNGKAELSEDAVLDVLKSEVKKRKDSIVAFKDGNREDLVEKEELELKILEKYLPEEISQEEIEKVVKEIVGEKEVLKEDFGKIMKEVMIKLKGKADGKKVSEVVNKIINQ